MKAYIATDRNGDEGICVVCFAESAGKAKAYIVNADYFPSCEYTDIRVRRVPMLDKFYSGRPEMDWSDPKERVAMVRYANMECSAELSDAECRCEKCEASKWCRRYELMHDDEDWRTPND